ncbi:hypothetical protein AB0869_21005 [Micromonospora vinacea]|uniref:hypothetical protein n=1 Tax=Micromonospora vinacea TaxID=709878 RepID=UPI003452A635
MTDSIEEVLLSTYNERLVRELLKAHTEAKQNFYLGGHRLSAVEGGRFCEAAFRILEEITQGSFTPLGSALDTTKVQNAVGASPSNSYPKSIRIYIPRALRVVYDIRNSRDAAHLGNEINTNLQDATLVVSILDWVLAELYRLGKHVSPQAAQGEIEKLVSRKVPSIQQFDDRVRLLRTDLRAGDATLVLLYHAGHAGVSVADLTSWVPVQMRANIRRTIRGLEDKALVDVYNNKVTITYLGRRLVESDRLLDPPWTG